MRVLLSLFIQSYSQIRQECVRLTNNHTVSTLPCIVLVAQIYVTVSGKTRHMAIFTKIAIALYLSSTTFELTLLQVRDRSPAPFPGYSALCPTSRELLNSRNYGLKGLLCARIQSPYTTSARKSPVGGAS